MTVIAQWTICDRLAIKLYHAAPLYPVDEEEASLTISQSVMLLCCIHSELFIARRMKQRNIFRTEQQQLSG